jgi:hypothetical protein
MYFYDDLFKVNVMTILTNNKNNNKTLKKEKEMMSMTLMTIA